MNSENGRVSSTLDKADLPAAGSFVICKLQSDH